jgi:hypothetical protein
MQRHESRHDGLTLSLLAHGGDGRALVALHSDGFKEVVQAFLALAQGALGLYENF